MTLFGPVYEAAHSGNKTHSFNLIVLMFVVFFTWLGYFKRRHKQNINLWIPIVISVMCGTVIIIYIRDALR